MKLYRCSCSSFSPLKNKFRQVIKKKIVDESRKIISVNTVCLIEYFFFELGGGLDEYQIICQIKKLQKKNSFRIQLKISILEKLYLNKNNKVLIDRLINILCRIHPLVSLGIVTYDELVVKKYLLNSARDYLFLVAFDEYYFLYDKVIKSEECIVQIAKEKTIVFFFRLYSTNEKNKNQIIEFGSYNPFFEKLIYFKNFMYGKKIEKKQLLLVNCV